MSAHTFLGYPRPDCRFGVRNHLAVLSSVACVNEVTRRIATEVGGAALLHSQGCGQLPTDMAEVRRVLANVATNPNVGAVLVVGLGCEGVQARDLAADIGAMGWPVEMVSLQETGGYTRTVERGIQLAGKLQKLIQDQRRTEVDLSELTVGIKCGGSDATSGIVTNKAAGLAGDLLVAAGGCYVFCETTELIGAEHLLAQHAMSKDVGDRLCDMVHRFESNIASYGVDMRGGQPSPGNMAGGITTIEEKSLGVVCKAGSTPLRDVLRYGERPPGRGLFFMESPGREKEAVTGLAAAGAQVVLFTTGRGAPQGFPVVPVVKISANASTCSFLGEHIDVDVSGVMDNRQTIPEAAGTIFQRLLAVASGDLTRAEVLGYTEGLDVYVRGPVI